MPSNLSEIKSSRDGCTSNPERLAYWYLRLNGFLLLENFIIHPDRGNEQRTDADLLGVRFANRSENPVLPMADDPVVADSSTFCNVVIVEVKKGRCELNGPWTRQDDENIQRVLRALGCFPESEVNLVAKELYKQGRYATADVTCRLLAFGDYVGHLAISQIMFDHMIQFIHNRFKAYRRQKSSIGNWPLDGRILRQMADRFPVFDDFKRAVRCYFGLGSVR